MILEDAERIISSSRDVQNSIAARLTPETVSFANCILPLAHADSARDAEAKLLVIYQFGSTAIELRQTYSQGEIALEELALESRMRSDVFALVAAVYYNPDATNDLDGESRHLPNAIYRNFVRASMKLSDTS